MDFKELIKDQFMYGGKKYGLNTDSTRESTDILFDEHGKNWLFGTIDKYTYRYKNLGREKDLLKIATYMYIIWLKRGFFVLESGINSPVIDTNLKVKEQNFEDFWKSVDSYEKTLFTPPDINTVIDQIHTRLVEFSGCLFTSVHHTQLVLIVLLAKVEWEAKFKNAEKHDTDTWLEKK